MKNAYERFIEEICSNCKDREKKDCSVVTRIDNTLYCDLYERENRTEKNKKQYMDITAKQLKPLMKGLV